MFALLMACLSQMLWSLPVSSICLCHALGINPVVSIATLTAQELIRGALMIGTPKHSSLAGKRNSERLPENCVACCFNVASMSLW